MITFSDVKTMADSLKIIYDDREKNQDLQIILKLIKNAQRVFFLGFGFADENLEILGIPETIENKLVYGTAMGFTETETKRVLHKLRPSRKDANNNIIEIGGGFQKRKARLVNTDCLTLLREYLR